MLHIFLMGGLLLLTIGRILAAVNGLRMKVVSTGAFGVGRMVYQSINPKAFRRQIIVHWLIAAFFGAASALQLFRVLVPSH